MRIIWKTSSKDDPKLLIALISPRNMTKESDEITKVFYKSLILYKNREVLLLFWVLYIWNIPLVILPYQK